MVVTLLMALLWAVQGIPEQANKPVKEQDLIESTKTVPKRSIEAFLGDGGGFSAAPWSGNGLKLNGLSGGWNPWNSQ